MTRTPSCKSSCPPGKQQGSLMAVVLVFFRALGNGDHASMSCRTVGMLELNRGVVDAEVPQKPFLHIPQDALARRRWNVGNGNVAGERMSLRANAPDMEVVNVVYTLNRTDRQLNLLQLHSARCAFEKDVERLADNTESRPENQHTDGDRQNRVDPIISGEQDGPASGDDRSSRQRVSDFMQQGTADIYVAARAIKQDCNGPVHHHPGSRYPHHDARMYLFGVLDPFECLVKDEK